MTDAEVIGYSNMQARLIDLLLRHDERWFRKFYDLRTPFELEPHTDALRRYREIGILFYLRDELFEHILPRIVRHLSFESPRSMSVEEPPTRGRVDWERTLDATWAERPGETPLLLHTRQRRRDFATPENLLTVVTLLQYRADVEEILWDERATAGNAVLRHPLNEIIDRCDRELQFPQFAGMRLRAQEIIEGADGGSEMLEARVGARLLPGSNSAYEELLAWRERRRMLQLLRRESAEQAPEVLGADPKRDNYLYQLWIFFELADLLSADSRLLELDTQPGQMRMQFRWGKDGDTCVYELRHDQHVPDPVARWQPKKGKAFVPGVRPDYYLWRVDPPVERIEHGDKPRLYWREPGVVWDAKYYRERERTSAPSSPVKRMIADLQLLGEQHGVLLFAFLGESSTKEPELDNGESPKDEVEPPTTGTYELVPEQGYDHTLAQEQEVWIRPLRPGDVEGKLRGTLYQLLGQAHRRLGTPRVPACYGIFLDTVSATGGQLTEQVLKDRYGTNLNGPASELVICPKPHVGPWRVDLVSRAQHCCRDPKLCQIISQPGAHKPVRPARDPETLVNELRNLFEGKREIPEDELHHIERHVAQLTRSLAEATGATQHMEVYYQRLRDLGMRRTLHLLPEDARESLALAIFLVEQLDKIAAKDFSGPAIQIGRVVEGEVIQRVLRSVQLEPAQDFRKPTLGNLTHYATGGRDPENNRDRINVHISGKWQETGVVNNRAIPFWEWAAALNEIKDLRNKAAHPYPFLRDHFDELQMLSYQGGPLGIGALNVLLLAWQEDDEEDYVVRDSGETHTVP